MDRLKKLNLKLGATVFTKYGTKRGGVALGRMLPFGVGAAIGGGAGAGVGTAVALLRKGKNVRIREDQEFEIELKQAVVLPVLDY